MVAENGELGNFTTEMTWTSIDGKQSHTHKFQNFSPGEGTSNISMSPTNTLVLDGELDVGTNRVVDWEGVPVSIYIGNGRTFVAAVDDVSTNSHFGSQPIYGLVTSFTPCGSPGPGMEVYPRCE
jgi:hypothetical protein